MVTGRVITLGGNLKPFAEISVYGRTNVRARVQAVVDTGFTEYMTLPTHAIRALDLRFAVEEEMSMANGVPTKFEAYLASVNWNGQTRVIRIHRAEGDPLIGMAMLRDHDLHVRSVPGGIVSIDPIS